jgi:uncharacterized protein YkwD
MRPLATALFCATLLSAAPTFADSLHDSVNAARRAGCNGRPGVSAPLRSSRKLDSVASRIAGGKRLSDALKAADYRALHSSSLFMSNTKDNAAIARTIAQRACEELRNASVKEIGVARKGANVWVVLAEPFEADELKDFASVSRKVLNLANAARARARRCGSSQFPAAPPLTLASELNDAARAHARDLARHNTLSHTGSDGSSPAERATRAGYAWRTVGENVASGPTTAESVMEGWLASPGHCENLMSPKFTEMGIGYVVDAKSDSGVYWSQVFGARRSPRATNKQ